MTVAETRRLRRETPWNTAPRTLPIFLSVRPYFDLFTREDTFPSVETIDQALRPFAGARFVRQREPSRRGRHKHTAPRYDDAILAGTVPTREGSWHDFMNALVWAAFPAAKRAVHTMQHAFLARAKSAGIVGRRLPEHDALAVLDEGGILVLAQRPVDDDHGLEGELAAGRARAICFGHAVLEAIAIGGPWPLVRAAVLDRTTVLDVDPLAVADADLARFADEALTRFLARPSCFTSPKDLLRVSLAHLGVPAPPVRASRAPQERL